MFNLAFGFDKWLDPYPLNLILYQDSRLVIFISIKSVHPKKENSPTYIMLDGIVILRKFEQSLKASSLILFTPSSIITSIKFLQPKNAPSPILWTLDGIIYYTF